MLFRQSAKHDSYYISCEKKSREWILRHTIYVCVGGGVSPPPLNVCLR